MLMFCFFFFFFFNDTATTEIYTLSLHDALPISARPFRGCEKLPRVAGPASCGGKEPRPLFGEGSPDASVMLVGEQPGDREDLSGHPFVGPAGGLLDRALEKAGIPRGDAYLTNVVKHFNWEA